MLSKLKNSIIRHLTNIPGWRTNRKIVVFESDDWGAIRMPSVKIREKLIHEGVPLGSSQYNKVDTLENREDLSILFELLQGFNDFKKKPPVFTFNTVMGNPDFSAIEEDYFSKYYFQPFTETYREYYGENLTDLWSEAIDDKLIVPQFHCREHLNVSLWMKALRDDVEYARVGFNNHFYGIKDSVTPSLNQSNYLCTYWPESEADFLHKVEILKDGLTHFKKRFGYTSKSFVACNYVYSSELENTLFEKGVRYIQGQRGHISPDINGDKYSIKRKYIGQRNLIGQIYTIRNCNFEPALNPEKDCAEECLKEIESAFFWKKPAIISSHRANYVSGLSTASRDRSLRQLQKLLNDILEKWPEVEFMDSSTLGSLIEK